MAYDYSSASDGDVEKLIECLEDYRRGRTDDQMRSELEMIHGPILCARAVLEKARPSVCAAGSIGILLGLNRSHAPTEALVEKVSEKVPHFRLAVRLAIAAAEFMEQVEEALNEHHADVTVTETPMGTSVKLQLHQNCGGEETEAKDEAPVNRLECN